MANTTAALRYQEGWKLAADLKVEEETQELTYLETNELNKTFPSGIRRGTILEIYGRRSSGRTSISHQLLAQATRRGEICAVVDLCDSFHPASAFLAGIRLEQLVWVRCGGNLNHAMRASDLLLHAGGFGLVNLDLCESNPRSLNKIPLSYWYRFRKAIERTPAILLVCADSSLAKSSAYNQLQTKPKAICWEGSNSFCQLNGLEIHAASGKGSSVQASSIFLKTVA